MRRSVLFTAALLTPLLSGCRYSFVPVIPAQVQPDLPARVTHAALSRDGQRLRLSAQVDGAFPPGYLSVAWFDGSAPLGTDSVYLDGTQRQASFELTAPTPGAYRAVLSFGGAALRQVELYEVSP